MRTLQLSLAAVAVIFVVVPLAIFLVAWAIAGFGAAAHWAAVYLLLWCIVMGLVPLGIALGLTWKGLPFVHSRLRTVTETIASTADRANGLVNQAGSKATAPNVWLHARAAWVRAFVDELWRQYAPGQSHG